MDDVAICACRQAGSDMDLLVCGSVIERRPALTVLAEGDDVGLVGVEVRTLGIAHVVVPLHHRHDAAVAVIAGPRVRAAIGVGNQTIRSCGRRVVPSLPLKARIDLRRPVPRCQQPLIGQDEPCAVLVPEVLPGVSVGVVVGDEGQGLLACCQTRSLTEHLKRGDAPNVRIGVALERCLNLLGRVEPEYIA